MNTKPVETEIRKTEILNCALAVFLKYGFRKTSMDEVARAASISRQGLYLHFAAKEDLFKEVVENTLQNSLEEAKRALNDTALTLEEKLAAAFDAWMGRFVGMIASGASDLGETSKTLVGSMVKDYEELFLKSVHKTVQESDLKRIYSAFGLKTKDLVDTLNRISIGLKHSSSSRSEFAEGIKTAARVLCVPLRGKR
ncbi:TetR/AcrR family transcriptional regulator [Leptospira ellisii]|uniref:TetR/AcrR family transcriptional regulator n=1 Tax=Leptospira ellisii TaxID=2023197 RepID=A0A2N0BAZ7_9LEPT|nr:TetR/AcrR family transcriptional regulator [Leptospira ellisii]MDV6234816.1 TetR/AcrR family transcriptional regulator [Leptospira ellisii]PJZ93722.1 hypothetical protein CH379_06335 [Leptospira ellisii]PKA06283.1 hypothetical protein CH375_00430 [Leptospira ellisii]